MARKRGKYQPRSSGMKQVKFSLEPGLLVQLQREQQYQGLSLSAIGSKLLADALQGRRREAAK